MSENIQPTLTAGKGDWLGVFVIPRKAGLWEMTCGENDYEPERVAITRKGSTLLVHCEHLGIQPLKHYHDGLTSINWRLIA